MSLDPISSVLIEKTFELGIKKIRQKRLLEKIYFHLREIYCDIQMEMDYNKNEKKYQKYALKSNKIPSDLVPYINLPYTKNAERYFLEKLRCHLGYNDNPEPWVVGLTMRLAKQLYPEQFFEKFGLTTYEKKAQENIESFFRNAYTPKITDWC